MEMLVVMGAFGVCLFLGSTLIVTALKVSRIGEAAANQVSRRQDLARHFRDDVARAETAPDKLGALAAGPGCLILQMPGGSAISYQWGNETLERSERIDGKETRQQVPIGPTGTRVEFISPSAKNGIVTLRISDPVKNGSSKRSDISAAIGGDWR